MPPASPGRRARGLTQRRAKRRRPDSSPRAVGEQQQATHGEDIRVHRKRTSQVKAASDIARYTMPGAAAATQGTSCAASRGGLTRCYSSTKLMPSMMPPNTLRLDCRRRAHAGRRTAAPRIIHEGRRTDYSAFFQNWISWRCDACPDRVQVLAVAVQLHRGHRAHRSTAAATRSPTSERRPARACRALHRHRRAGDGLCGCGPVVRFDVLELHTDDASTRPLLASMRVRRRPSLSSSKMRSPAVRRWPPCVPR